MLHRLISPSELAVPLWNATLVTLSVRRHVSRVTCGRHAGHGPAPRLGGIKKYEHSA